MLIKSTPFSLMFFYRLSSPSGHEASQRGRRSAKLKGLHLLMITTHLQLERNHPLRACGGFQWSQLQRVSSHRSISVTNNTLALLAPIYFHFRFDFENHARFCPWIKVSDARHCACQVREGSMRTPLDGHSFAVMAVVNKNIKPDNDVTHRVASSLVLLRVSCSLVLLSRFRRGSARLMNRFYTLRSLFHRKL